MSAPINWGSTQCAAVNTAFGAISVPVHASSGDPSALLNRAPVAGNSSSAAGCDGPMIGDSTDAVPGSLVGIHAAIETVIAIRADRVVMAE
jgi:hypothetical protein